MNGDQFVSREMFHARVERLKKYSAGSKLGRQRKAEQIRKRVRAIGDKAVKK